MHRSNHIISLVLVGWLAAFNATANTERARLAIVPDNTLRAESDLLTAELDNKGIDLLERSLIDQVLREQALQLGAITRKQSIEVGRMLKADGLLLLTAPTNDVVAARLVAVNPGVVLWYAEFGTKADDSGKKLDWLKPVTDGLQTYLPKLSVDPSKAIPVSLMRLRPQFNTPQMTRLTDDLNRLLLLRLLREPSLYVLEREKLMSAREESFLAGVEPEFWTGSYVVEGRLSYDLLQSNQVTYAVSVRPPTGPAKDLTGVGRADDLAGLVDDLAAEVGAFLGAKNGSASWNQQQEAARLKSLAAVLHDPIQQADALATAMALGSRDIQTASAYRSALRGVAFRDASRFSGLRLALAPPTQLNGQAQAFLNLVRFCNEYRPTDGFSDKEASQWLLGSFSPLADTALFFETLIRDHRESELDPSGRADLQAACQEMASRILDLDTNFDTYRQRQVLPRTARYFYSKTIMILEVYRHWATRPAWSPHRRVAMGIGEAWYLDRQMAEPVFATAETEPEAQRDVLWHKFIEDIEQMNQPELKINLAIMHLAQAGKGQPQVEARHALQQVLIDNAGAFREASYRADFSDVWALAFPPFQKRNGKFETAVLYRRSPLMEINTGRYEALFEVFYERYGLIGRNRGAFQPAQKEDVQTDAQNAWQLFLAITPKGQLREPDLNALVRPYLDFITEEQARAIYQRTLDYQPECPTCTSPVPVDAFVVQQWLGDRFPSMLDNAHRAEAARRQQEKAPPANALVVTNTIPLPNCPRTERPELCARKWADDRWWAVWGDDIVMFDDGSRSCHLEPTCELIPLPDRLTRKAFCAVSGLEITDAYILCWLSKHEESTEFGLRDRQNGDWRFVSLPFEVRSAVQLDETIYLNTVVPRLAVYQSAGLASMDPETLECKTLRAPGAPRQRTRNADGLPSFESLPFEFTLQVKDGLLLESNGQRIRYGWDPKTNKVHPVKAREHGYTEADTSPHLRASQPFGFTFSPVNGMFLTGDNGHQALHVVRDGRTESELLPLVFRDQPSDAKAVAPSYNTDVILTESAVYIPFRRNRGLYKIPYTDIQDWLNHHSSATNAPSPIRRMKKGD